MNRLYAPLTERELRQLQEMGLEEHESFFQRNPHLRDAYHDRLIGICLCQGAARHYLDQSTGIKDFDVWHFYEGDSASTFPYRARKRLPDGPKGKPVDFLKRAIPHEIVERYRDSPKEAILTYLRQRDTETKRQLLKKAVIGLYPDQMFGMVLWQAT